MPTPQGLVCCRLESRRRNRSPRCLREPCFVFRASRNDHDVALAADPLFTAEAEFHSVLHRVSRTAPSRLTGSALTGRQLYGATLKSVPNRRGSPQRDGSGGYQMRACARVALVLVAVSASIGLAACSAIDDLKAAVSRWFDVGKSPGGRGGVFTDDLPDTTPMIPPEKPLKKEASKASKKKDKSKVQRPQTVEKKLPTSDSTQAAKPQ